MFLKDVTLSGKKKKKKEVSFKGCILYNAMYVTFLEKIRLDQKNRSMVWGREGNYNGHFQGDGNIQNPDCDGVGQIHACVKIHRTIHQKGKK